MAKDLRLDVITGSDPAGLIEAAAGVDELAKKTDKLGTQMKETAADTALLDASLEATKLKVDELSRSFAQSGDTAMLKQINATKRYQSQLEGVKTTLESAGKDVESFAATGEQAGEGFTTGLSKALSEKLPDALSNPYMAGALAGVAVVAAPVISSAIAVAVTTGFGLGVIGLGAISLKDNPQVKSAFSGLSKDVQDTLSNSASPMIGPLVSGIEELDSAISSAGPALKDMFSAAGPGITALADGIGGLVDGALPGFVSGMQNAAPVIEEIGADLPQLGAALGDVVSTLSSTPGTVNAVDSAFNLLDGTMVLASGTMKLFGGIMDPVNKTANFLGKTIGDLTNDISGAKPATDALSGSNNAVAAAVGYATAAIDQQTNSLRAQATAIDAVISAQQAENNMLIAGDNATLQLNQAQLTFHSELKKGAKYWDESTAAGIRQVGNLNAVNAGIQNVYNSSVAINGPTKANTSAALGATEALYKQAKAAGASSSELSTLKTEIQELKTDLAGLHSKSFTITEYNKIVGRNLSSGPSGAQFRAANEFPGHAAGGSYGPGPMLVGERGPEIVVPNGSGTVVPNSKLGGMFGSPSVTVELHVAPGFDWVEGLLGQMRQVIRTRYGANVIGALSGVDA